MTMFYEKLLEVSDSSHVKTEEKMSWLRLQEL